MSPGSVTERPPLPRGSRPPTVSRTAGAATSEDIEVLEITLDEAMAQVRDGRIIDAKTIMLIQHLRLDMLGEL